MKTHYELAWEAYKETSRYQTTVKIMISKGMIQPYIDNILKDAFEAGYCARIKNVFDEIKKKL